MAISSEQVADLFRGGKVRNDARLVVGGAAPENAVSFDGGFEGGRVPELGAHGRLHVVVRVKQHSRLVRRCQTFGVDGGASAGRA